MVDFAWVKGIMGGSGDYCGKEDWMGSIGWMGPIDYSSVCHLINQ